jgi:hypothetical protein
MTGSSTPHGAHEGAVHHPGQLSHEVAQRGRLLRIQEQVDADPGVPIVPGSEAEYDAGLPPQIREYVSQRNAPPPELYRLVEPRVGLLPAGVGLAEESLGKSGAVCPRGRQLHRQEQERQECRATTRESHLSIPV